jgi:hypothetical protein
MIKLKKTLKYGKGKGKLCNIKGGNNTKIVWECK